MLTLRIDNNEVENIFIEGFNSNKEKFLAFIQNSYQKREELQAFEADREQFLATYKSMQDGSMQMIPNDKATQDIDIFLDNL
ncbi:MAG TPA: hypothetical protein EYG98_01480 [Sulfurovum sp.]|nr:hypothetical protein [Sulfurovum sp.]